jgi:EAL domain-containing protein (putative c-di-GMP-specific phosphodiesterase class I)
MIGWSRVPSSGTRNAQRRKPGSAAPASPQVLLVGADRHWSRSVRAVAHDLGGIGVHTVPSGRVALDRLLHPSSLYSHVLMNPARDDGLSATIRGLTCDEEGSGTALLLLGRAPGAPSHGCVIPGPSQAAIRSALVYGCRHALSGPPPIVELRAALAEQRIDARYQPLVRLADRKPAGVEALARLHRFGHPMLAPEHFVPRIEAAGLASELTELVLVRSFADMTSAVLAPLDLKVALNFSLDVLLVPDALHRLEVLRTAAGIAASRVVIELTESRIVTDLPRLRRAVLRLRDAGYGVALDDVSPAMPRNEALLDMPFTAVKLDKGVVIRGAVAADAAAFIRRIVALARPRGITVIAEGVEDRRTWRRVKAAGIDLAQGFIVGRPLPAQALPAWVEAWSARADLD